MGDKLAVINQEIKDITIPHESDVSELYNVEKKMNEFREEIRKIVTCPQNILPFLAIGRIVY